MLKLVQRESRWADRNCGSLHMPAAGTSDHDDLAGAYLAPGGANPLDEIFVVL